MAHHDELLTQARALVAGPNQADWRRAVSAAYYALFHLLVQDAAHRLFPKSPALAAVTARAFEHGTMAEVCTGFTSGKNPKVARLLGLTLPDAIPKGFSLPISAELTVVAEAFTSLQEERHKADYELSSSYPVTTARDQVRLAIQASASWNKVRSTKEGLAFAAALLLWKSVRSS